MEENPELNEGEGFTDAKIGPFLTSNLANAYGSLTVGSVQHTQKPVYKVVAKSSSGASRDIVRSPYRVLHMFWDPSLTWLPVLCQ